MMTCPPSSNSFHDIKLCLKHPAVLFMDDVSDELPHHSSGTF